MYKSIQCTNNDSFIQFKIIINVYVCQKQLPVMVAYPELSSTKSDICRGLSLSKDNACSVLLVVVTPSNSCSKIKFGDAMVLVGYDKERLRFPSLLPTRRKTPNI